MNPTILSVLSALAAASWSVWTWQSERYKARELKRNEMSAQYVNTFILATQELQRKLFKILEKNEFAHYTTKYKEPADPASSVSIDLLSHLSAFFGWGLMTYRFGPYTRDSKMIALMAEIGEVLESRNFPGEAFRFSVSDRHALGQVAVRRVGETSSGPAFMSITRFKFEEEMLDGQGEWARLFRSEEVRCTLAAIDRAVAGEALEGRERLAVFQNLLVDLVSYLERQEGFRVSCGERQRVPVETNCPDVMFRNGDGVRILHQMPGRIRLGIARLHADAIYAEYLQLLLQTLDHIESVRINVDAACVVVEYSNDVPLAEFIQSVVELVEDECGSPSGNETNLHQLDVSSANPSGQSATSMLG